MLDQSRTSRKDEATKGLHAIRLLTRLDAEADYGVPPQAKTEFLSNPEESLRAMVIDFSLDITPVVTLDLGAFEPVEITLGTSPFLSSALHELTTPEAEPADFICEAAAHTANLARILPVDEDADNRIEAWLNARDKRKGKGKRTRLPRQR